MYFFFQMVVVVQSCRYVISNFIRSFLRHTNSEVPTVLIDLWNIIETNYLVLSMTHGNITGPPFACVRRGLRRCRRRRVNVIIGRPGGMVQGNGILKVNGSLSQLRSPLRPSPRQAGLPFLSFLSRVSLSWPILPIELSVSLFLFRFYAGKISISHRFPIRRSILH